MIRRYNQRMARIKLAVESVSWRDIDGEIVAIDLRRSEYLSISASGASLWRQLVDGADERALVDTLIANYAIDESVARRDVEAFVEMLRERQLIKQA